MSALNFEALAEGLLRPNKKAETAALVEKWQKTGLLRGLSGHIRESCARLFENETAHILNESIALTTGGGSMTSSGQIQGFTSVAFPMIRRIFGGLIANELVSIQPMSLPTGLICYIDYVYGNNVGGQAGVGLSSAATQETYARGQSIYNNPSGKGIQSGSLATGGGYDLVNSGYSRLQNFSLAISGSNLDIGCWRGASATTWTAGQAVQTSTDLSGSNAVAIGFDPQVDLDLANNVLDFCFVHVPVTSFTTLLTRMDTSAVDQIALFGFGNNSGSQDWGQAYQPGANILNLRRLNRRGNWSNSTGIFTPDNLNGSHYEFVVRLSNGGAVPQFNLSTAALSASVVLTDALVAGDSTGSVLVLPSYESDFGSSPSPVIPELEIKLETISLTAESRKLRARWSPEMSQDINAYHNLDLEVEITGILSQEIAVEIDSEVLLDILNSANGANLYWSRAPGKVVNKLTGVPATLASSLSVGPQFFGNTVEWYSTLVETIVDVANTIHRKTLRAAANFIVIGPDVATILESTALFRAKVAVDGDGQVSAPFTIGAEQIGTVNNRFTAYKTATFPRNKILVGYKGGSYLETGYVYAPYVPLILTPVIYQPDSFTPSKGIMTRYAKKIVRSDYYGTVTCMDMNFI